MPGGKRRLRQLLTGGANITGAASLKGATALEGTTTLSGRLRGGTSTSYTELAASGGTVPGRQTMAGKARVRKEVFFTPGDFARHVDDGHSDTLLIAGSLRLAPSGSIFTTLAVCSLLIPVLEPGNLVTGAGSAYKALTVGVVPTDADTSGSVIVLIDYTLAGTIDSGSDKTLAFYAGMQYITPGGSGKNSCPVRTATCQHVAASYPGTASGEIATAQITGLSSFGVNDRLFAIQVGVHASASPGATNDGCASAFRILGVRLRYTANVLGLASAE